MKKNLIIGSLVFLLIVHIYNFQLIAIPIVLRTVLTAMGGLMFLVDAAYRDKNFLFKYERILMPAILLFFWGYITMAINGSNESIYTRELQNIIAVFFSAYFIARLSKNVCANFNDILLLVSIAVFVENAISIIGYFVPSFGYFMLNIQPLRITKIDNEFLLDYFRIFGLGNAYFFGVLPSCVLGLFSLSYLIAFSERIKHTAIYVFMYTIIAVTCFLTARTSAIFILLSLISFFFYKKGNIIKRLLYLLLAYVMFSLVVSKMRNYLPDEMLSWAFEITEDPNSSGTLTELVSWWTETSFDVKTFLIGDAKYMIGDDYYKNVDVGFFRQIYYGGIIGLGLKILINYRSIFVLRNVCDNHAIAVYTSFVFISYLIIMAKGDASIYINAILVPLIYELSINNNRR